MSLIMSHLGKYTLTSDYDVLLFYYNIHVAQLFGQKGNLLDLARKSQLFVGGFRSVN